MLNTWQKDDKIPAGLRGLLLSLRRDPLSLLLLLAAVAFNLYHLYPEVAIQTPRPNDGALHLLALERTAAALAAGQNPTDFWLAPVGLGYPLFHHYQHLAYLPLAGLHHLSGGLLSLPALFYGAQYLLLGLFPLSIYGSMRRFGFEPLPAALAGLLAPLLATEGLYGFDVGSYVWRGAGLYTQLWGMVLLPLAVAQGYHTLRCGRGYLGAVLLLAATLLCHLVSGYIAVVSLAALALAGGAPQRGARLLRLGGLLLLLALVAAYFLWPFYADRAYMNRSVWEQPYKYDAYGHAWTLEALLGGELFDAGRFPVLTLLAGLGLVRCLRSWRQERCRLPVILALLWLLLFFGRPTWGPLLELLPFSRELHFHRLIAGLHLGGLYLMGLGLAGLWRSALTLGRILGRPGSFTAKTLRMLRSLNIFLCAPAVKNGSPRIVKARGLWPAAGGLLLTLLLLYPAYAERAAYLEQNGRWLAESRAALAAEAADLDGLLAALAELPPGRVYAGLAAGWGKDYTLGYVPMYALLTGAGLDTLGHLYHALSLNSDIMVLFDERRPDHYNLFNVRYVVAPAGQPLPDFVTPVKDFGRHRLYRVETGGYFELVGTDVAFTGDSADYFPAALAWLNSILFQARQHPALLLRAGPVPPLTRLPLAQAGRILPQLSPPPAVARGRILAERATGDGYRADIEAARESLLLLKTAYHPGWRVRVDGAAVTPLMVMPAYLGVPVSPGPHRVEVEYRAGPLRAVLAGLGLLLLPLIALAERRGLPGRPAAALRRRIPAGCRLPGVSLPRPVQVKLSAAVLYPAGAALLALLAGLPLFHFQIMAGHDALEYLPRAVEFYEGLKPGLLFPRWAPDLSGGYGQPFFNFNPPLFYYAASLFRALGFSFVAAQNWAILALLLAAGLAMYRLAGDVFGRQGGLAAAASYLFAPYLLSSLYVRHALADFSAFAVLPLAFWGLYRFALGSGYRFLLAGALAVALLLLSSNPVALITVPCLGLLVAWLAWGRQKERAAVLGRGLGVIGAGLGLSAFFWLPALSERELVQTARLLSGHLHYSHHFVYPAQLLSSAWGYGLSGPGPDDGMSFAIGPVHLLLVGAALWLLWRRPTAGAEENAGEGEALARSLVGFFGLLFFLALFFASWPSRFLWDRLPLLPYLEFPWRFLSLAALSAGFLGGAPFLLGGRAGRPAGGWLLVILIGGLVTANLPKARPESFLAVTDADFSPQVIAGRNIAVTTAREYEPVWVRERPPAPAPAPAVLPGGQGTILTRRLSPVHYLFQVSLAGPDRLRINTFYFPGWGIWLNGVPQFIELGSPYGLMELSLPAGEHLVELAFGPTPVRRWSSGLSLLALLALLAPAYLRGYSRLKKPTRRQGPAGNSFPASDQEGFSA